MHIKSFINRLAAIGVNVELRSNYPWVYLHAVNGTVVLIKFQSEHGFTAFYLGNTVRFSNRRIVFKKIRQILAFNEYMILSQEISEECLKT